jgi:esterase/lipase superfamily enzyme
MGRFFEWEDRGMMELMRGSIEQGHVQFYCVDAVDSESWYCRWKSPHDRAVRQTQYDLYVCDEVMPLSRSINSNPFAMVVGASFGAYHALNFALRHPEVVGRAIGLSGLYDIRGFADGQMHGDIYFNSPVDFMLHETNQQRLARLRNLDIILAVGRGDRLLAGNERMSQILWDKGIWNALRIWDGFAHDWPDWKRMLPLYLQGGHH